MSSSETALISFTISSNVLFVPQSKLFNSLLNHLVATIFPHGLGAVVCVRTSTIPVTWNGFWIEGKHHSSNLGDPLQNVTSDPQLISSRNSNSRANLKFPLAWHHFSVNSTNVNSCIEASLVVRINNVPSKGFVSTNTTIIGALWARVASDRPA
uniref:Uncharacterized protein n=1 Tax=Opuntia streptacantha TaxID=393608 RepID=A0A7C8ZDE8_OPUST